MSDSPGAATRRQTPPVVAVMGLGVRYPDVGPAALTDVAFEVHAGELVGIVGLNGSGKSTLCRCLNGIVPQLLEAAVTGSVTVAGRDAIRTPVRQMAAVVGMVLDQPGAQLSQATAEEEVALGLEARGVPYADMVVRVEEALRAVGLEGAAGRSPHSLSGGEQQRLLLAAVMVTKPSVLVLDEPTSGLDPRGKAEVFALLLRLCRSAGTAVLVAEHDVETLAEFADRILVLDRGRLVADGPAAGVLGSVATMGAAGLLAPQVAEVALAMGGRDGALPVTVDGALEWLAGIA